MELSYVFRAKQECSGHHSNRQISDSWIINQSKQQQKPSCAKYIHGIEIGDLIDKIIICIMAKTQIFRTQCINIQMPIKTNLDFSLFFQQLMMVKIQDDFAILQIQKLKKIELEFKKMLDYALQNHHSSHNEHKSKHSSGHRYSVSCNHQIKNEQSKNEVSRIKVKQEERPKSSKKINVVSNTGFSIMGKMIPSAPASIQRVRTQNPSSPYQENYLSKFLVSNPMSKHSSPKNIMSAYNTPKNQESKISMRQMNIHRSNDNHLQFAKKSQKLTLANPQKPQIQRQCLKQHQTSSSYGLKMAEKQIKKQKVQKSEQYPNLQTQIALVRQQLFESLTKHVEQFKYRSFQQAKHIAELQRKLQQNQKSIKNKDKKIQELKKAFFQLQQSNTGQTPYRFGQNSHYVIDRIKDIELRMQICHSRQDQLEKIQQRINQAMKNIQKGTIKQLSARVYKIFSRVQQFMSINSSKLEYTEQKLEKMVSKNIGKLQQLFASLKVINLHFKNNQLFKSFGNSFTLNKSSGFSGATKNTQESIFSFGKLQDFQFYQEQFSSSISSDYFCYPEKNQSSLNVSSPKSQKQDLHLQSKSLQKNMSQSLKILIQIFQKQPQNLYVDAGGHLRYKDSGIYVFDKKTSGLITLNQEQKDYFTKKGLLQKRQGPLLRKRAFI